MADIFISYAREDRPQAKLLAGVLEARGWDVWWDRELGGGHHVIREIQEELERARCAIVLWSERSVASDWVIAEAEEARQRGILLPVAIDDSRPPLVFRPLQTTDLRGWDGEPDTEEIQKLIRELGARLGLAEPEPPAPEPEPGPPKPEPPAAELEPQAPAREPPAPEPEPEPSPPPRAKPSWLKLLVPAAAVLAVLLFVAWQLRGPEEPPPERGGIEPPPSQEGQFTVGLRTSEPFDLDRRTPGGDSDLEVRPLVDRSFRSTSTGVAEILPGLGSARLAAVDRTANPGDCSRARLYRQPLQVRVGDKVCVRTNAGLLLACQLRKLSAQEAVISCFTVPES